MIYRSPFPDVEIPNIALTDYVLAGIAGHEDKPALIDGSSGHAITYGEFAARVRATAAGFAAQGLTKGDVIAIYSCNVPEYAIAFHGAALAGLVITTVNPLYTVDELTNQLVDSRTRLLVTAPEMYERAEEAALRAGVSDVYVFGEAVGGRPFVDLYLFDREPPVVEIDPANDVVALPYSSGTTGLPKGVMLTHRNIISNLEQFKVYGLSAEDDVFLCVLPMFHIYGMVAILNVGLSTGTTIVTMARFELEEYLGLLQHFRVTFAHVVPPIVLALAKHPSVGRYDLSSLRTVFSGAAPLGRELSQACAERLGVTVVQGYGMTESSPATHVTPGDPARAKPGSVGFVVPNTICRLVDVETGENVGPNRDGEVWVSGPQVMKGYLNNPEATARTVDSDGWLHTGDVAYADEDGYFFIVDRVKELIKYKGFQVSPAELEALLLSHPDVADVAVIPIPDAEAGEVPKAFVVRRGDVDTESLKLFVAERVAPFKKLREIEFVEAIPKSPSGKILRRVLVAEDRARRV